MSHGGPRKNSGRPPGSGRFGSTTKAIRVPEHLLPEIYQLIEGKNYLLPLYGSTVKAGFPSPADDYLEGKLDLNNHLIKHPAATFLVRASGDSMTGVGICNSALLVVDRSIEPTHGKIVIVVINGEMTVKRFSKTKEGCFLIAENKNYPPIPIKEGDELHIWGVVTHAINDL